MIQLWEVSYRDFLSRLELVIDNLDGEVIDMKWLPLSCDEKLHGTLPRLGILAIACSGGGIAIYSVPDPSYINTRKDM